MSVAASGAPLDFLGVDAAGAVVAAAAAVVVVWMRDGFSARAVSRAEGEPPLSHRARKVSLEVVEVGVG